ncbi:hypothetical protein [uncultured Dysosmobacter sp.]|uniref:hypothetical protein n=1 Tax=uncultured Dysosmobacter sp. TaxID=2591384 RepID=UPI0026263588|nr:hypothetical protein [uncultured Dysosmobacter sp.]
MKHYKRSLAMFLAVLMLSTLCPTTLAAAEDVSQPAFASNVFCPVDTIADIATENCKTIETDQALDTAITIAEETMSKDDFFEYFSSLPGTSTQNEYDVFLEEQSNAIARIHDGTAQPGDEELASFDYRKYYYDLKELNEDELEYMGYDQKRIDIIKNFQGSEDEIRRASADVSGTVLIIHSQISANIVTTRVRYRFYIDGVFAKKMTDSVCLGNANDFVYNDDKTTASCSLVYLAGNGTQEISKDVTPRIAPGTSYGTVIVPFDYTIYKPYGPSDAYPHYIKSGSVYVTFENNNGSRQAVFCGQYKHLTKSYSASDIIAAGINLIFGNYSATLINIVDFILKIQTNAESYGPHEALMTV